MSVNNNGISVWRIIFTIQIVCLHMGLIDGGYIAVEFFFILSGFLLAKKCCDSANEIGLSQYIWNRFIRLYPLYFMSILIFLFSINYLDDRSHALKSTIVQLVLFWKQLFMLTPFGRKALVILNIPSWYVCVLFYLSVLFFVMLKYLPKNIAIIFLVIIMVIIYTYYYVYVGHMDVWERYKEIRIYGHYITGVSDGVFRGMADMALGVSVYYLFQKTSHIFNEKYNKLWRLIEYMTFGIVIVSSVFTNHTRFDFIYVLLITLGLYMAFLPHNEKVIQNSLVNYFSRLSYSVYLNHAVFSWVIFLPYMYDWTIKRQCVFFIAVVLTSILASEVVELFLKYINKICSALGKTYSA